jgi:diaminohydroxyphosphoribosylaminopyrimidine deaminase / 5-amino-6-(5-phosphoribosylamino)uracil reductase
MKEEMFRTDRLFMRRAVRLAEKGAGRVNPNPMVGAVLVKQGRIIGEGYHEYYGGPHAEANAIGNASRDVKGATLYVTLEPCNHQGKTPPCCPLIVKKGIVRVVIGIRDPNPDVAGNGADFLMSKGIEVATGVLEKEILGQNAPYLKFITTGLPYVLLKSAMTLDGKIATVTGKSRWISCEKSRLMVHRLRYNTDAVMVGINTVLADDPLLRSKISSPVLRDPLKVVLDSNCRTPLDAKILTTNPHLTIIATTERSDPKKRRELERSGAQVIVCREQEGHVDLHHLLEMLGHMEISHVMVEAGSTLAFSVIRNRVADRALLFIAPKFIGGKNAPSAVGGKGIEDLEQAVFLKNWKMKKVGEDLMVEGDF